MNSFPTIKTIDDVLPHIKDHPEIIVVDKGNYTYIDYVLNKDGTFDHPMRLECRGLKFDKNGTIIARPFHKFFNVGERENLDDLDFDAVHKVHEKLDGSMVHACLLEGKLTLMTRKGISDQAIAAEKLLTGRQRIYLKSLCEEGYTPVLEYTGPANQIVLEYSKPELTLLTIRNMVCGTYAYTHTIPEEVFQTPREITYKPQEHDSLYSDIRESKADIEGVVIVWMNGHRLKIKSDEYLAKHRIATGPQYEIHYLKLILDGKIDDVLALKSGEFRERLEEYYLSVNEVIIDKAYRLAYKVVVNVDTDQKTFAVETLADVPPEYKSVCFNMRKDRAKGVLKEPSRYYIQMLKQKLLKQKDLDENRWLIDGVKLDV